MADKCPIDPDIPRRVAGLERQFHTHLKEDELRQAEFARHKEEYLARQARQDTAHEQNLEAIQKLAEAVSGVVSVWTTIGNLQKFFVWLSGFGGVAAAVLFLYSKFN